MAQAPPGGVSIIDDYGEQQSKCGYCGARRHATHGMMTKHLTAEAYQELLDRGWRRSGQYVYYPLHDRSCCQLFPIRLDVTKFSPNKEQRRTVRRWQAHLDGAPMRAEQQQPAAAEDSGPASAPFGSSPKRPHDDIAADEFQWGTSSLDPLPGGGQAGSGGEGSSKRSRRAAAGPAVLERAASVEEEQERAARGSSPTSRLSEQLEQALRSGLLQGDLVAGEQQAVLGPSAPVTADDQQQQQQHQRQQQGEDHAASKLVARGAEAAPSGGADLASQLAAAVQQVVAAGLLPAATYPAPKVHAPNAKQRKVLPAGVTHTTAYPLAVAAVASRAMVASAGADGGGAKANAEQVAALLVQYLPADVAAAVQAAQGHLNFSLPQPSGPEVATGSAGAGSKQGPQQKQQQQQQQQQQGDKDAAVAAAVAAAAVVPRAPPRHFELRTLPSSDASIVQVEFQLFKKYQVVHHGDEPGSVSPTSFKRFLVDSPLPHVGPGQYPPGVCPPLGFGSFHQQYWLDGRLVAVGVVDVLPKCLSSVYLFWDPDMAPLALGKLTSLKEIEWVQGVQAACPALRYYYLGFYIHNCHRMRYKGDYAPSDLLCPKNKCWVPLDRIQDSLAQPGMVPISELPGALQGLGADHAVDPATGQPSCAPRQPSASDLAACKLLLRLPSRDGQRQSRVLTLGALQAAGVLQPGGEAGLVVPLGKWWSRAGPAAAALTAYSVD